MLNPYNMRFNLRGVVNYYTQQGQDPLQPLAAYLDRLAGEYDKAPDAVTMRCVLLREWGDCPISVPVEDFAVEVVAWVSEHEYMIRGLWESTVQKYSMIENYDRFEDVQGSGNNYGSTSATSFENNDMKPQGMTEGISKAQHKAHMHGNIGVTTAAQMIQAERELRSYSFYKAVAKSFAADLITPIYF